MKRPPESDLWPAVMAEVADELGVESVEINNFVLNDTSRLMIVVKSENTISPDVQNGMEQYLNSFLAPAKVLLLNLGPNDDIDVMHFSAEELVEEAKF